LSGCSEAEIAIYSGLSLSDVRDILDKHYLNRDPALARSALAKLEKRSERERILPTDLPTGLPGLMENTRKAK
jgi:hypothetical protein